MKRTSQNIVESRETAGKQFVTRGHYIELRMTSSRFDQSVMSFTHALPSNSAQAQIALKLRSIYRQKEILHSCKLLL